MNSDRLLQWSLKASKLRTKYEQEKTEFLANKLYTIGLQNLISNKQIPLYNNIMNYSALAIGMVKEDKIDKSELRQIVKLKLMLENYLEIAEGMRDILNAQNVELNKIIEERTNVKIKYFLSLVNEEEKLSKKMKNISKKSIKEIAITIRSLAKRVMDKINTETTQALNTLHQNKTNFEYLQMACLAIAGISTIMGIDVQSTMQDIRSITNILAKT